MKPLFIHPGASFSTHDVYVGLTEAWRASGRPWAEWRLDGRLARAWDFLNFIRQKRQADGETVPDVTASDLVQHASSGMVERALMARCDAIVAVTAQLLDVTMLELAREVGLKVYVLCTESPYCLDDEIKLASRADGCWTNERTCVSVLHEHCDHVAYLPHAWRQGVHDVAQPYDDQVASHDVVFVGSYFTERVALLEQVDWTGIDLGLYGLTDMIPDGSPLKAYVRGEVADNAVTAALYRRARVGLNLYRSTPDGLTPAESLNPRAYELAAAGCGVVSQWRAEANEKFGPRVPLFETGGDLQALLASVDLQEATDCVRNDHWGVRVEQVASDMDRWAA